MHRNSYTKPGRQCALAIAGIAMLLNAVAVRAQETGPALPLWELGLGASAISVPHYRGSRDTRAVVLPFVFPIYRGDRWRLDSRGIRGVLFRSDRIKLDLSGDAGIGGGSSDVFGRDGMPSLNPTVQVGPSLEMNLWRSPDRTASLQLNLPVRAVFEIDSGLNTAGATFSPHLTWHRRLNRLGRPWTIGLSAGFEFGSTTYHDLFYTVDPAFARSGRAAYEAESGFAGTRFQATLVSRTPRNLFTLFARYDSVDSAVFEDSPLVFRSGGLTAGIAIAWFVARSEHMVSRQR